MSHGFSSPTKAAHLPRTVLLNPTGQSCCYSEFPARGRIIEICDLAVKTLYDRGSMTSRAESDWSLIRGNLHRGWITFGDPVFICRPVTRRVFWKFLLCCISRGVGSGVIFDNPCPSLSWRALSWGGDFSLVRWSRGFWTSLTDSGDRPWTHWLTKNHWQQSLNEIIKGSQTQSVRGQNVCNSWVVY